MKGENIVTIDLGTRTLKVSVAQKEPDGKLKVSYFNDFPSAGIKNGKVLNPSKLGEALRNAISLTEEQNQIKINEITVNYQKYGIRQQDCSESIDLKDSFGITQEDIDALEDKVTNIITASLEENEEIIGVVPQCYDTADEWSINPQNIVGMYGSHIDGEYKTFIGKKSFDTYIDASFNACGITLARKVFSPEFVGRAVLQPNELSGGVALIDLGAGASSLSIFYDGVLRHYAAIPFGGDSITMDICNVCGITDVLAENIKLDFGGCMPEKLGALGDKTLRITDIASGEKKEITVKYLSEIITARQSEIIEALLYEIQRSGVNDDHLKHGIVLIGGGAYMRNLCPLIKNMSGFNARIAGPSRSFFEPMDYAFYRSEGSVSSGLLLKFSDCDYSNSTEDMSKQAKDEAINDILFPAKKDTPEVEKEPLEETKPAEEKKGGIFGFFKKDKNEEKKEGIIKAEPEKETNPEDMPYKGDKKKKSKKQNEDSTGNLFSSVGSKFEKFIFDTENPEDQL